ncbi:MAG TPA: ABC transporter ATP-binding protein [Herpetosiphonaceae bacterium]
MRIPLRRYLSLFATYLKPQWVKLVVMACLILANIGLQVYNPQILSRFIDAAAADGAFSYLLTMALLFLVIAIFNQFASVLASYVSARVAWTATNSLRRDLVAHCLSLDMRYHTSVTPGEMIERIDGDVTQLSNFFSLFVINVLSNAIVLLVVLTLFFGISWFVGIAMTLYVMLVFAFLTYLRRLSVPVWEQQRRMSATFFGFLSERLAGTEDLRANDATAYTLRRFLQLSSQWYPVMWKANSLGCLLYVGSYFLFGCGIILVLALGAYLWSTGAISLGVVYLMFAYANQITQPIQQIRSQLYDLQQAEASLRRVEQLLATRSAVTDGAGKPLPEGPLAVAFERVTFGYVADEPVLRDVSFHVQPGEVLGLLGRTGSGKTTIAHLLFRLYDPQEGEIRIGDLPLRQAALRDLRKRIGLVTQNVQLFHASVRDNLTFFDPAIGDAQILATLDDVGLMPWYRSLADGLDTILTAGGGLSAGQAQLLAFTRVFLADPSLVILDEASSRLDPATEHLIEQAIGTLLHNRSAIIIAHRLATIQRADSILIIEDGQILEYGRRAALADDPGSRFVALLRVGLEEVMA